MKAAAVPDHAGDGKYRYWFPLPVIVTLLPAVANAPPKKPFSATPMPPPKTPEPVVVFVLAVVEATVNAPVVAANEPETVDPCAKYRATEAEPD